ncbi:MAG TPA: phosphoribosyltransferase family protein [Pseudomonadales bacterium]
MTTATAVRLTDAAEVERLLDVLARAIAADLSPDTALVGIVRRGAPLAQRLAERLRRQGHPVEVGELALKLYDDTLERLYEHPHLDASALDLDVKGRHLILVDDVLYTGESLLRAVCHLHAAGARRLQIAVLCSRGRPLMPIHADFVGLRLEVDEGWIVECHVPPYEEDFGIHLVQRP